MTKEQLSCVGQIYNLMQSINLYNEWATGRKFYTPEDELEHYKNAVKRWDKWADDLRIRVVLAFEGMDIVGQSMQEPDLLGEVEV